jgi:predicted metalloprotease with PDZ domain
VKVSTRYSGSEFCLGAYQISTHIRKVILPTMTMIDSQTMVVFNNDTCLPDDGIPVVVLSLEDSIQDLYLESESVHQSNVLTKTGAITASKVDCVALQPLIQHSLNQILNQPAFSSATVTKKSEDDMLGMGLRKVDGVIQVSFLKPGCLLSEAPFKVGDKLVSINNRDCTNIKSLTTVAKILKMTIGLLTVVVEHAEGDPMLVESMILKETPTCKTGLGVCSGSSSRLRVSSVHPKGPFSGSLLSTRDQILSINGRDCTYLHAREAATLIINAASNVTIVAKKGMDNAAVVAFAPSA